MPGDDAEPLQLVGPAEVLDVGGVTFTGACGTAVAFAAGP